MEPDNEPEPHSKPVRNFYIEDEMVVLRVESRNFKVHRYFLKRDSEVFEGMFSVPTGEGSTEGKSDDTAIPLPGVTIQEMECLLDFLYYGMYEHEITDKDSLVALLSISSRFVFSKIRQIVIDQIDKLDHDHTLIDPVQKVELSIKFDVPDWLVPAYTAICLRKEPLTVDEAQRMGLETAIKLASTREETYRKRTTQDCRRKIDCPYNQYHRRACDCCLKEPQWITDGSIDEEHRNRTRGIVEETFDLREQPGVS